MKCIYHTFFTLHFSVFIQHCKIVFRLILILEIHLCYYFCSCSVKFLLILWKGENRFAEFEFSMRSIRIDRFDFSNCCRRHEFPTSPTCEKVFWSICCIVHQALPPSSSLTPPPEGTVTTTGPNNYQVLLTFRVSLPIFKEKKGKRKPFPPFL